MITTGSIRTEKGANMQYILTGFRQDKGFRVFAFEGAAADRTRTGFTVRADLALVLRYGIKIQELPLLCRELLEKQSEGDERTMTFTEKDMCSHVRACKEARDAAQQKRKPIRRPAIVKQPGVGWRATQQSVSPQQS